MTKGHPVCIELNLTSNWVHSRPDFYEILTLHKVDTVMFYMRVHLSVILFSSRLKRTEILCYVTTMVTIMPIMVIIMPIMASIVGFDNIRFLFAK